MRIHGYNWLKYTLAYLLPVLFILFDFKVTLGHTFCTDYVSSNYCDLNIIWSEKIL